MLLIIDGVDMTGKTQIGRTLSSMLNVPYFKHSNEWRQFEGEQEFFKKSLQYGATFVVDFIEQTGVNAIMDRFTPSEYVYSRLLLRPTDLSVLEDLDQRLAKMGAKQVICRRKNYIQADDRYPELLTVDKIRRADTLYEKFIDWTRVPTFTLWVDDEDIDRECDEVIKFLGDKINW